MKPTADWDEQYVLNLPPGEHDWVEFKGVRLLDFSLSGVDENDVLKELSKQLSAFANSGGGNIIYGIKDAPAGHSRRIDSGGVTLSLKGGTKEWLEDIIPNLVEFPLSQFNVYTIIKEGISSGIDADKAIFVIEVPDSEAAPHQANDKRYYARVGGKSKPIGHRLVLDIVGRAKYPKMELSFEAYWKGRRGRLQVFCENVGKLYANYVNGFINVPTEWVEEGAGRAEEINGKFYRQFFIENIHKDLVGYKPGNVIPSGGRILSTPPIAHYISRYDPVLPGLGFYMDIPLTIPSSDIKHRFLFWEIYADNAPVERGSVRIGDIKNIAEKDSNEEDNEY